VGVPPVGGGPDWNEERRRWAGRRFDERGYDERVTDAGRQQPVASSPPFTIVDLAIADGEQYMAEWNQLQASFQTLQRKFERLQRSLPFALPAPLGTTRDPSPSRDATPSSPPAKIGASGLELGLSEVSSGVDALAARLDAMWLDQQREAATGKRSSRVQFWLGAGLSIPVGLITTWIGYLLGVGG
jgi:hypothetical protein